MPVAFRSISAPDGRGNWVLSRLHLGLLGCALWALLTAPALALMIGAPQTRAELGLPLRMDIPVRLDGQESLPMACVQAQAQAGESGGNVGGLAITSSPSNHGLTLNLRSLQPLREPIVTVRLHLACQFQRTQVYTLLVDPPAPEMPMIAGSAVAAAPAAPAQSALLPTQPAPQAGASAAAQAAAGAVPLVPQHSGRSPAVRQARVKSLQPLAAQPAPRPSRVTSHPPPAQSRLEMDQSGLSEIMARPELRLALALPATLPNISQQQRAQFNQLRQLIFDAIAAPGQAQPTLQQIAALQARANVLQRQFEQAAQQAQQAQRELARVRAQSYSASVVYGLLAALLALGVLSFWLWRRGADPDPADSPFAAPRTAATSAESPVQMPFAAATPTVSAASSVQASTIHPPVMPFGLPPLVDGRPLQPEIDAPPPPSTWGHSGFGWDSRFLQPATLSKQVQVDELMDASQLAEYFIETGDDERAIDLLEKSLDDSASSHYALPYLLLFDLYRKHGRKQEFEALYQRFGRRFNVAVPSWDEAATASGQGRNLMDYDRAMKLITLAWGKPQSVSVIEHMLLDDPNRHRMGFDLPAYRDLLMLYAVARDLFPDAVPAEHVELETRLASAAPDLDFELPLVTESVQAASGASTSEFRLQPPQDEMK